MVDTSPSPGMIILLRVWMDGSGRDQLRARLISSFDNMNSEHPIGASSGVDAVVRDVRTCLEQFTAVTAQGATPDISLDAAAIGGPIDDPNRHP
jgi:hypothetical protein